MRILYLHQYFKTPTQGGAVRSYYLGKALVDAGHDVEIITTHNQKEYKFENIEGLKVHYLPIYYHNNLGFISRIFSFISYHFKAFQLAKNLPVFELCYATSTPLSIGMLALKLKKKLNLPFYFEVRDLWPEAPVQLGYIKNYWLKKWLYKKEKQIYVEALKIIALSPGMRDGIEKVVAGKYASLLPNMSDCEYFTYESKNPILEQKYGTKGKFVIAYTGALGAVNHVEGIIEICKILQLNLPNVMLLVAGEGKKEKYLTDSIQKHHLNNIKYLGAINKDEVRNVLNVSDAALVSFLDVPILHTNSPNKFFDAIASGKLIITNTGGWITELIETKNCGFAIKNSDYKEFIRCLSTYISDKELLEASKLNSRRLAENYFNKAEICRNFVKLFDKSQPIDTVISSVYTLTA